MRRAEVIWARCPDRASSRITVSSSPAVGSTGEPDTHARSADEVFLSQRYKIALY